MKTIRMILLAGVGVLAVSHAHAQDANIVSVAAPEARVSSSMVAFGTLPEKPVEAEVVAPEPVSLAVDDPAYIDPDLFAEDGSVKEPPNLNGEVQAIASSEPAMEADVPQDNAEMTPDDQMTTAAVNTKDKPAADKGSNWSLGSEGAELRGNLDGAPPPPPLKLDDETAAIAKPNLRTDN